MNKILITGGCGFIGHHLVEHILIKTDWEIIILDKLNYASFGLNRFNEEIFQININNKRLKIYSWDLIQPISIGLQKVLGDINYIVHMAAETHVDNSIKDPVYCVKNNIISTLNILEYCRKLKNLKIMFNFSTDEVYGPALNNKLFREDERHNPTNPYSASKSSSEQLCSAYYNTYKIPIMTINVMNAFGEKQHVEKFIPLVINKILKKEKVSIHSYPDKKKTGSRFYIHARNIADAVLYLIKYGKIGDVYNLKGEKEISNLDMANLIAKIMNSELNYEIIDFHSDRPGHDLRYGLNDNKIKKLGWNMPVNFYDSLEKTIKWTLNHKEWLNIM
tara:strand:- start:557 stop:1555 length:999 start_codon:yes stop_codon:yes gene_type:complete